MAEIIETCPIWGNRYKAKGTFDLIAKMYEVEDSDRTFGGYKVSQLLLALRVKRLSDREKAWLTTWIVDQFNLGNYQPEITRHVLRSVLRKRSLRVYQRADRLLPIRCERHKFASVKMAPERFAPTNIAPERSALNIEALEQFALTNRIFLR